MNKTNKYTNSNVGTEALQRGYTNRMLIPREFY